MLEIGCVYSKPELTQMLGTRSKQGIDRKLDRYGVVYEVCGRGERAVYTVKGMADPFKVFAITELGYDANTDFTKLRMAIFRPWVQLEVNTTCSGSHPKNSPARSRQRNTVLAASMAAP